MEKYHSPGDYLSKPKEILERLVTSPPLSEINKVLGYDGDLYLVGGVTRAAIEEASITDIDIASSLTAQSLVEKLTKVGFKVYQINKKHNTIKVLDDNYNIEITSFRTTANGSKNLSNIEQDLAGRDFTINSIAFGFKELDFIDPFNGIKDLKDGLLKATGKPEDRIKEDFLRILRTIRFGPAAGRKVDPSLLEAAGKLSNQLKNISAERIRDELEKILMTPYCDQAFRVMLELGIIKEILPEVIESVGFEQNEFHNQDVFEHTLSVIKNCPDDLILKLTALFHDLGKPATFSVGPDGRRHFYNHELVSSKICEQVMTRLCFPNQTINEVNSLVKYHMRPLSCGAPGVRRLMRDLGELMPKFLEFKKADKAPAITDQDFWNEFNAFSNLLISETKRLAGGNKLQLAINGDDLKTLGFKQGKLLGNVLKILEEEVINNPDVNTKEYLTSKTMQLLKNE